MNTTLNLVVFFILATVASLIIMFAVIIAFLLLVGMIPGLDSNETLSVAINLMGIVVSMVLTFIAYSWLMRKAVKWFKLEQNVPQLFKKKK